jgi:hypothetical protein
MMRRRIQHEIRDLGYRRHPARHHDAETSDAKRFPRERLLKIRCPRSPVRNSPSAHHGPAIVRKRSSGIPRSCAPSTTTASNALLPRRRCGSVSRAEDIPLGGEVTAHPHAVHMLEWGVRPCRR